MEAPPSADVAEHMSRWFDPLAAIRLQAVEQAVRMDVAATASPSQATPAKARALAQDLQQVRTALANAITQDPLAGLALGEEDPGYGPYHQRHLELQRQMAQKVSALRERVRQSLAASSPGLRQLALLDATFEHVLAEREQGLLSTVALLLERCFQKLRGGPREEFAAEWRQALLNELDLRLEPVAGMVDALRHESGMQP